MDLRNRIFRALSDPELLKWLESEAMGSPTPDDPTKMIWRDGRRSLAVELVSTYREVENERRNSSMGE